MTEEEKRFLIECFIDAYNNFNIERMMELIHPNIEFTNVSSGKVNASASGERQFRNLAEQAKALFSSRKQSITKFTATGDGATVEIEFNGKLAADLPNGMKAGDMLNLTGSSEFVFSEGKIFRLTDYS